MTAKAGVIEIDLQASTAKFQSEMKKATQALNNNTSMMEKSLKGVQGAFTALKVTAATLVGGMAVQLGVEMVKSYAAAEKQIAALNSALSNTGRFSEEASRALENNAKLIQSMTKVDADDLLGATAKGANFAKNLNTQELQDFQRAVVGLSEAIGKDLNTTAMAIGKTIGTNANALKKLGVDVDMTGDQHERLNQILQKTESLFNQAADASTTLEGRAVQLHRSWEDLNETMGGMIAQGVDATGTMKGMTDIVIQLDGWLQDNADTITSWVHAISSAVSAAAKLIGGVIFQLGGFVKGLTVTITRSVELALNGINFLVKKSVDAINWVNKQVNKIPGIPKAGMFAAPQIPTGGLKGFNDGYGLKIQNDLGNASDLFRGAGQDIANMFSGVDFKTPLAHSFGEAAEEMVGIAGKKAKKAAHHVSKEHQLLAQQSKDLWAKMFDDWYKPIEKRMEDFSKTIKDSFATDIDIVNSEMAYSMRAQETELNKLNEAWDKYSDLLAIGHENQFAFLEAQQQMNLLISEGAISQERANMVLTNYAAQLDGTNQRTQEFAQAAGNAIGQFGDKFFDTFVDGMKNGKFAFKDFVASALEDLAKLIFKLTVTIPLAEMLTNAMGGGKQGKVGGGFLGIGGNILGSIASGLLGGVGGGIGKAVPLGPTFQLNGALASGGPFQAGNYLVGENGPEIASFGRGGYMTPNHAIGGTQVIVQQSVNVYPGLPELVRAEINKMRPQLAKDSERAFIAAAAKGGDVSRTIRNRS